MAINKTTRKILKALSFDEIDVEKSREFADLKRLDLMKIFYRTMDMEVENGEYDVPVRIFFPDEESYEKGYEAEGKKVMLFLHGGGWVTDHVDSYGRICARLAEAADHVVVAVEYRLAPEFRFPTGLTDCYAVAKSL